MSEHSSPVETISEKDEHCNAPGIFSNIKGDLFGGLTAGIVALPLALAFGEQTELGAIAGLYGAIAIGIIASIFGGTNTQISGPTAPMTVVSALIIADAIDYAGSFEVALPIIIATFLLAGFLECLLGIFRIGSYIKYISYPVVSGFMSGIGVIIVITQLFPLFGMSAPQGGPMGTIREIHKIPEIVNFYSVALALSTIAIIYLFPKITKSIPSALIALLAVSLFAFGFIPEDSILRINSRGEIPSGLPELQLGFTAVFADFSHMLVVFEYAFTLAALGAIDSLLTSVVADNMTKTRHNSNQELIGQGLGNMGAALIGGLPGAGATMRTVINVKSGGKTKLSGVIAGTFLLFVLLGLGKLVGFIPNAVLAGILVTVGIGIVDYRGLKHLRRIPIADAVVMIAVLALTVFVDLLVAVGAGMVLSAVLFMKRASDQIEKKSFGESLSNFSIEDPWIDETQLLPAIGEEVYIKHITGPLFFGFASRFREMLSAMPRVKIVILRLDLVPHIDQTGLYALEEGLLQLSSQEVSIAIVGLQEQPRSMLERIHILPDLVPNEHVFDNFEECMKWLSKYLDMRVFGGNVLVQDQQSQSNMTPTIALEYLKRGNSRFVNQRGLNRNLIKQVEDTGAAQYPFASILSCIDSRMPVEKIFDQGIGDIFNARIAGNFINEDILGSLEFACKLAGSKLIVIMGHSSCGAVKGACDNAELGNLTQMLAKIKPAVENVKTAKDEERSSANLKFVDEVAEENVRLSIKNLLQGSPVIAEMETAGEIKIIGAMYNVKDGVVRFFD